MFIMLFNLSSCFLFSMWHLQAAGHFHLSLPPHPHSHHSLTHTQHTHVSLTPFALKVWMLDPVSVALFMWCCRLNLLGTLSLPPALEDIVYGTGYIFTRPQKVLAFIVSLNDLWAVILPLNDIFMFGPLQAFTCLTDFPLSLSLAHLHVYLFTCADS